jgi:hypothetical protein
MDEPDEQERWWERGPVLANHQRHKKKLVPPLLTFQQTSFVSTIDQIFPELFWMCLVFQDVGPHRATRSIIPALKSLYGADDKPHWYRTSALLHRSNFAEETLQKTSDEGTYTTVINALALLRRVYRPEEDQDPAPDSTPVEDAEQITEAVRNYWDKNLPAYCSVLATCIVGLGVAGKMKFPPHMLEGVNDILDNPGSDSAEATCSMLRAASMAMFPVEEDEIAVRWWRRFWNTNYRLSSCEFRDE